MKKTISLLLALVLCFMLAACGSSGTGNEDYDYIISLLDRGEYDMAIQVIEMLRTGSSAHSVCLKQCNPKSSRLYP